MKKVKGTSLSAKEVAMNDIKEAKGLNVKKVIKKEDLIKKVNEVNLNKIKDDFKKEVKAKEDKESAIYINALYEGKSKKEKKSLRMKVRRIRNTFAKDIIKAKELKDNAKVKSLIKDFFTFYKATYKVNDLSFHSLSAKNNDEDTFILLSAMLKIIKEAKVK